MILSNTTKKSDAEKAYSIFSIYEHSALIWRMTNLCELACQSLRLVTSFWNVRKKRNWPPVSKSIQKVVLRCGSNCFNTLLLVKLSKFYHQSIDVCKHFIEIYTRGFGKCVLYKSIIFGEIATNTTYKSHSNMQHFLFQKPHWFHVVGGIYSILYWIKKRLQTKTFLNNWVGLFLGLFFA